MNKNYEDKTTQKQRLLNVLRQGKRVTQINITRYLHLLGKVEKCIDVDTVDAIADLGIANLPARIWGLKKDGYNIKSEDMQVKGRYCNTHYSIYYLED